MELRVINNIKGTQWEPLPGRASIEVPISVQVPDEDTMIIPQTMSQEREITRRDLRIYSGRCQEAWAHARMQRMVGGG